MGVDWRTVRVAALVSGRVLTIGDGYRAKNSELAEIGLPFARAGNVAGGFDFRRADRVPPATLARVGNKTSEPGDVVFTSKGTVGRFAFVGDDAEHFVYSPQLCFWRSDDRDAISPRFLFFWFHSGQCTSQLDFLKGQTDMADYVSLRDQRTMKITLPPIAEQRAIATVLGALDDKVASNRRAGTASEEVWLITGAGLLREALPVSVSELSAETVLEIGDGFRAKNRELADEGLPFVRAGNLTTDGLDLSGSDRVPASLAGRAGSKRSRPWDTAFTSKGTVGRMTLVEPGAERFVYSPQICFWRSLDASLLSPFILHAWMRSARFKAQVDAVKGQTDMADYVSLRDQRAMTIDFPDPAVQQQFTEFARPMAEMSSALRQEARTLTTLRDALLPKLVSGQIRVPLSCDPEEALGAATEQHERHEAAG